LEILNEILFKAFFTDYLLTTILFLTIKNSQFWHIIWFILVSFAGYSLLWTNWKINSSGLRDF